MPAPILHFGASVICTHGGQAMAMSPSPRVSVSAQPAVALTCVYTVVGCALTGTPTPPCIIGQFIAGATRVLIGGVPAATLTGSATCIPTGTPMLPLAAQTRVLAT